MYITAVPTPCLYYNEKEGNWLVVCTVGKFSGATFGIFSVFCDS